MASLRFLRLFAFASPLLATAINSSALSRPGANRLSRPLSLRSTSCSIRNKATSALCFVKPPAAGGRMIRTGVSMDLQFTAVFRKVPEGYIAFVEEFPGANAQGATLEEARINLREAVMLVVEANRAFALEDATGADVIREPLKVTA